MSVALPAAVAATRDGSGSFWRAGAERDPRHSAWLLRTGDPEIRRRGHSATTRFDAPIAVGASLADPAFRWMADARRRLCVGAVRHGFGHGPLAAPGTAALLLRLDWLFRWCADRDTPRLSLLRPTDLRDFTASLRTGAVLGLLDLDARLAALADSQLADLLGDGGDPLVIRDGAALARLLGVTAASLGDAPDVLRRSLALRLGLPAPGGREPSARREAQGSLHMMVANLEVWSRLRTATERGWLADGLGFVPVDAGRGARAVVSRLGATAGRTPTLDPSVFVGLLAAAARVVALQGPAIVASVGRAVDGNAASRSASERDVRHLVAAVAVLVGGLSGRRGGETTSIRRRPLSEGACGPELTTLIGKSGGKVDRVPVPAIVAAGVRALDALGGEAATGWLFRIVLPWGRLVELDPASDLAAFAAAEGFGPDACHLASHQLRRGMCLLWEYGYRAGTPAGLARACRHADAATGSIYVTEVMSGRVTALRDAAAAAARAAISAIGPARRERLLSLREMLRDPGRQPPCAFRYGGDPLSLLDSWAAGLGGAAPTRPALGVRIGSRAERQDAPLLPLVRAHAAALVRLGLLP